MSQVHVRLDGVSQDLDANDLDVGIGSTDNQVKEAVATYLNVPVSKFANSAVDRNNDTGDLTLRPNAVFGSFEKDT
jgi:hypothetical protein